MLKHGVSNLSVDTHGRTTLLNNAPYFQSKDVVYGVVRGIMRAINQVLYTHTRYHAMLTGFIIGFT